MRYLKRSSYTIRNSPFEGDILNTHNGMLAENRKIMPRGYPIKYEVLYEFVDFILQFACVRQTKSSWNSFGIIGGTNKSI